MARLETYQSNAAEAPVMRKWFLRAFLISIVIHLCLAYYFNTKKLDQFAPQGDRLVPRVFKVKPVTFDPKILDQDDKRAPVVPPKKLEKIPIKSIEPPEDKPSVEKASGEVRAAPSDTQPLLLNERPKVESSAKLPELPKSETGASKAFDQELEEVRQQILKNQPNTSAQALLKLPDKEAATNGNVLGGSGKGPGNFSDLNDLLGGGGNLKEGTAPILMPTDVLFEFDKADLLPAATESLHKLGKLIEKNPEVTFSIEGYTDSFGSVEHNAALSLARAETVRQWLVQNKAVDSSKIKTKGLGATRFIVTPQPFSWSKDSEVQAEIQRQKINRRVEIVLTFPKK